MIFQHRSVLTRSCAAIIPLLILASLPGATLIRKTTSAPKKSNTARAAASVRLPDATFGQPYDARIVGITGLAMGDFKCSDPAPALPPGLTLTCNTVLRITGKASSSSEEKTKSEIRITDVLKNTVSVQVEVTVWPASSTVVVGQPVAAENPQAAPVETKPDYQAAKIFQTQPLSEGSTAMSGYILPPLGKSADKHSVRVWITHTDGTRSVSALKGKSDSATTTSIALNSDSSYSLNLANPISIGETATLTIADPDGADVMSAPEFRVARTIPLADPDLRVDSELVDGASSINGRVAMPTPAIAPDNKVPPSYGNYPQVRVTIQDPTTKEWSQAQLNSASNPVTVQPDGSFSVSLKTPLKGGELVKLEAEPPFGREFATNDPQAPAIKQVLSGAALSQPTIATNLTEGATVISGSATPSSSGMQVSVAVLRPFPATVRQILLHPRYADVCLMADNTGQLQRSTGPRGQTSMQRLASYGALLTLTNSGSSTVMVAVDQTGAYKVTLDQALKQDDYVQVVQVLPSGASLTGEQHTRCASALHRTGYPFAFHRTNIDFVAGVLISNSSSSSATDANFSQANQFYALNVDHAWRLPGSNCENVYVRHLRSLLEREASTPPAEEHPCAKRGWHASWLPGINTYFDSRLTSIPVSTATANPPSGDSSQASSSAGGTSTLLTSQKVFRVSTGLFLPWVVTHGRGDHPTGLFIAPIAKVGFDTVTGARSATNVILPGNTVGSLNFQSAYNFYNFGGRIGNVELSSSPDRAPKIEHHLDVTIGRYSNLQSFICHALPAGAKDQSLPGSSCTGDYSTPDNKITAWMESRKQLWRLDLEGLIRIPIPATAIPFYVGFNANIAQHAAGVERLDHGYAPPDDIRILFATRIDIGSLLSTLNLGAH